MVITEDAVTRGVSMLEAAAVIRDEGKAEPVLLLPVVDRGGTVEAMADGGGSGAAAVGDRARPGVPLRGLRDPRYSERLVRIASVILAVSTNSSASRGAAKG